jgi:hypothetical protein
MSSFSFRETLKVKMKPTDKRIPSVGDEGQNNTDVDSGCQMFLDRAGRSLTPELTGRAFNRATAKLTMKDRLARGRVHAVVGRRLSAEVTRSARRSWHARDTGS